MRHQLTMTMLGMICATVHAAESTQPEGRARQTAAGLNLTSQVATIPDASLVRLGNSFVLIQLDSASGEWNATWLGKSKAAVNGVGFSVQVNDQNLARTAPKTTTEPFTDKLGKGMQVVEIWGDSIRITRRLRLYDDQPVITVSASMTNTGDRDVSLGAASLVDVSAGAKGGWELGEANGAPGVVYVRGSADPACEPAWDAGNTAQKERVYGGTMLLSFTAPSRAGGLTIGFLSALEARPDVSAKYIVGRGGTALSATQLFMGRKLAAGKMLELDPVYLADCDDPYAGLERYGDAVAAHCRMPIRKGANSMWCSWYAHRMAMTEDLVLANAAVMAKHFKPLGMDIVQMDHGWQQGDLTGNWVTNERFPHGLKWLAEQLRSKYGLKLGIWVAPTDVADTSELFKQHADWMLKDDQGKPKSTGKWFWKPNPNCYELDASNPEAARWIEDTFARLRGEGIEYFKIDFMATCGSDQFRNHDPYVTRGWSVERQTMESIRRGAGEKAWIRYISAPPLLSVGVGDSVCAGEDTADAGLGGKLDLLITDARELAAGYWLNDRLYHRELCDLSVRMQADIEEVRLRLAMMTLAGCSISFSDEFQYLPPSRIAMMQQCLPPGNPPMRPLDLFERTVPSIWHVHCKTPADEWDVVGLFNWEDKPQERTIEFDRIGLPNDAEVAAFEFWQSELLGVYRKQLKLTMAPQTSRIVALRRVADVPQVVGTDMHLLAGYHELPVIRWDGDKLILSGQCRRAAGMSGRIFVRVPPPYSPKFNFPLDAESAGLTHVRDQLWMLEIRFEQPTRTWSTPFVK